MDDQELSTAKSEQNGDLGDWSLHWLPVCFRIDFNIVLLVYNSNGLGPTYLSDVLLFYEPPRSLRSSGSGLLIISEIQTKTHGEASFFFFFKLWSMSVEQTS